MSKRVLRSLGIVFLTITLVGIPQDTEGARRTGKQVGTFTRVKGSVMTLRHPGKWPTGPKPHVKFQGKYYSRKRAYVGDRLAIGMVVQTSPGAGAMIVFDGGDNLKVGPATTYRVIPEKKRKKGDFAISMDFGWMRSIVHKKKKKKKRKGRYRIRTRTATLGVRGTDFIVKDDGFRGGTEVAVLRGQVDLKSHAPSAPVVPVTKGQVAKIDPPAPSELPKDLGSVTTETSAQYIKSVPKVETKKVTADLLDEIKEKSKIPSASDAGVEMSSEVAEQVKKLEIETAQNTMADIKENDPDLFQQLKEKKIESLDEIDENTIQLEKVTAPQLPKSLPGAKKKSAPQEVELEDPGEDEQYQKYIR